MKHHIKHTDKLFQYLPNRYTSPATLFFLVAITIVILMYFGVYAIDTYAQTTYAKCDYQQWNDEMCDWLIGENRELQARYKQHCEC